METQEADLSISLFGPMQVRVQGRPLPPLRSRKARWLLALLTLRHGRPVEREWLAGMLYPDMEQSHALANLRRILSELRSALGSQGSRLQSAGRLTLLLELTEAESDVVAFDRRIASKRLPALEEAVDLYRGPLLEGCTEEWVGQERGVYEQGYLAALQRLADSARSAGDFERAAGYCERWVAADPWSDSARRGWMEALAEAGDTNAALQTYRAFVDLLRDDPKAIPDEKTTALYTQLRMAVRRRAEAGARAAVAQTSPAAAISAASVVTGYLPHPLTELIGREDERDDVAATLRRSRLVTLTGFGGIGKTRLAIEVAREVAREYADGVWLVGLESLSDGRLMVQQIATVLAIREESGRSLLDRLTDHLRSKRFLLVLDNCEHLLEATAETTTHLLRECAEARILATSREALGITGETVWRVPPLATPEPDHLPHGQASLRQVILAYESVQLFCERACAVQKTFSLGGNNALAVARLCSQLEGIPLAIELAAARIRAMTVEQIAAHLHGALGLLTDGGRTAQSRQQTLRATLEWSYALLSEAERVLLRRLSVFAGGWTLEAADAVASARDEGERIKDENGVSSSFILHPLSLLIDKSLVVFEERGESGGRYRLLEMVRRYAAERLDESGETETLRACHRDYFVRLAERAEPELRGPHQGPWLQQLDREQGNLRAALESDLPASPAQERLDLRLTAALSWFWYIRGYAAEGRRHLERALSREADGECTIHRAKALNGAGSLAQLQADYPAAQVFYEQTLAAYQSLGDRGGVAVALGNLGLVAHSRGEYEDAARAYEASLEIYRKLEDRRGIAWTASVMGSMRGNRGDIAGARRLQEEAQRLYEMLGDPRSVAWTSFQRGHLALIEGDHDAAYSLCEEALSGFRELGDRRGAAWATATLGQAASGREERMEALALLEESLEAFRECGDRRGVAWCLLNLGSTLNLQNNSMKMARAHLEEGLRLFAALRDQEGVAEGLLRLAPVLLRQGAGTQAARLWGAASALYRHIGIPLPAADRRRHEEELARAPQLVGEAAFTAAWEEGRAMSWEQALESALEEPLSTLTR